MNEPIDPLLPERAEKQTPVVTANRVCPPFSPHVLRRQLLIDDTVWWLYRVALLVVTFSLVIQAMIKDDLPGTTLSLLLILFAGGWVLYTLVSGRVVQSLPHITELIEVDPSEAEAMIATALRRKPLQRSVRLLLYHRLAMLRCRADRFAEAAAICQTVTLHPLGAARRVKGHLLLLLAESRLQCRDLWGAWFALNQLHGCRLNLVESLQMLVIQVRYEVDSGHDTAALHRLKEKIAVSELMPVLQCGRMHAVLATAAQRTEQNRVAEWLRRRAELLCSAEQLRAIWPHPTQSDGAIAS